MNKTAIRLLDAATAAQAWAASHGADGWQRWLVRNVLLAAAYIALDASTSLLFGSVSMLAPWNPQAALAVVAIALAGFGFAPAVLVAVVLSATVLRGLPLSPALLALCVPVAASYIAAGYLLRRWTKWAADAVSPRDVTLLLAVSAAAAALVALLAGGLQGIAGGLGLGRLPLVSLQMVTAQSLGLIVLAPVLLLAGSGALGAAFADESTRQQLRRDLALFLVAMVAVLVLVFRVRPFDEFRMFYLMFLPATVVAMRLGLVGAALTLPLVQGGLVIALALAHMDVAKAFEFQLLMLALTITTLYLGALSSERERAARRLASRERDLRVQREVLSETQRRASTAELAAALAHDLNQPLSAIGTYANAGRLMADRDTVDRARLVKTLETIAGESSRAGQYVRRMRDFFRTGEMRRERVPVADLVAHAQAHLRDRMAGAGITCSADVEPGLPAVDVDAVQTGAVLGNLLANACDALATSTFPRAIRVTATRSPEAPDRLVRVRVEDSGPGIPEEMRHQLFKPLTTSKPHGMGLGLALSRSITERQGGSLWYDGDRARTTFCLELPIYGKRNPDD